MLMIARVFTPLQAFSSTPLIFFFFRLMLETMLILALIFPEEMGGSRPLITDVY
jgi:hypothetical protein